MCSAVRNTALRYTALRYTALEHTVLGYMALRYMASSFLFHVCVIIVIAGKKHVNYPLIKFADDTAMIDLIHDDDDTKYFLHM